MAQVNINHKRAKELSKYLTKDKKREYSYPIPWKGPKMVRFEVFKVPISTLRFNFNNTRIRAELEGIIAEKSINMDPEDENQQKVVEKILLDSKFIGEVETQKLTEDLQRRGQLDPVVSTADGVLIDGNRRLAIFRSLSTDPNIGKEFQEMDVSILPADATNEDLKELEMRIQMSHTFRVPYGNFNTALEFRYLHRILGWTLERIEELTLKQFRTPSIEDMIEIIDLVDEFLEAIPPRGKYSKRYSQLTKGWEPFLNLHSSFSYWRRKGMKEKDLKLIKFFGFQLIHDEKSTYKDVRTFRLVLRDQSAFERLQKDSDTLKGRNLSSFLEPHRVEKELENLHAAQEVLKASQEDPKKSLRLALRRLEKIKVEKIKKSDKEFAALLRSIKKRILELERRLD